MDATVSSSNVAMISPATLALEQSLKRESEDAAAKTNALAMLAGNHRSMISSKSLKRSRSVVENTCNFLSNNFDESPNKDTSSCSFDMNSFLKASQDVQEEILFPPISWPGLGDEDQDGDDDDDEREVSEPSPKRRCRGLTRSKNSSDLSSLVTSTRCGSNGSMC